jgi:acyl transferase domain-containing protein
VAVDVACRYLQTQQISGAIVAASNLYMSPEHATDIGAMRGVSSFSGRCHTFDAKADGYIKSEAVNAVILKRLDDALRDGDPIRAIIRGSATNSNGWTPGIASPSAEVQARAIREAYANANISDFASTYYLECHGTGTLAGDPTEVAGVSSVFAATRSPDQPLVIGSVCSPLLSVRATLGAK